MQARSGNRKRNWRNAVAAATALALLSFSSSPAWAAPFSFAPEDASGQAVLSTTVPIKNIGRLAIPGGYMVIENNAVEVVSTPEGLFDARTVLQGVVLKSNASVLPRTGTAQGIVYFYGGQWIDYVGRAPAVEVIERSDGKVFTGLITGGTEQMLTISTASGDSVDVPFQQISGIHSSRALSFAIPFKHNAAPGGIIAFGDAGDVRFGAAGGGKTMDTFKRPIIKPLGDEHGVSNATIAMYLFTNLVWTAAPAIAAPLVFGRSLSGPMNKIRMVNTLNSGL